MVAPAWFRSASRAAISPLKVSSSAIRRRRTRLAKTLNSISAMLSPTTVLGSVVKLQAFAYSPSLLGLEGFVEGSWFVGVEVVQHHPDLLGRWVSFIGQPPHLLSEVHHGTTFGHCHMPPARQGLAQHEQVSGAIALVLVIVSLPSCRLGRDRRPLFPPATAWRSRRNRPPGALGHRVPRKGPAHPPYTPQTRRSPGEYTTPSSATA